MFSSFISNVNDIVLIQLLSILMRKIFKHHNLFLQDAVVSYRQDIKVPYAQNTHLHLTLQCQYLP